MSTKSNASVKKHRAKMAEGECARMEVKLARGMINRARELARQRGWPL
jgi:hypothetical protein